MNQCVKSLHKNENNIHQLKSTRKRKAKEKPTTNYSDFWQKPNAPNNSV